MPDQDVLCPDCHVKPRSQVLETQVSQYLRRFPATSIFLAINIGVFLAMWLSHVSPISPSTGQLITWGATSGEKVLAYNQWWRLITSAFVHIGAPHLILNMWSLWLLGTLAEAVLGTWLYVGVYFVCALAGSLASLYWNALVVEAGASGALMGIVGVLVSVLKFARLPVPQEVVRSTTRSLLLGAGLTLAIGILPGIANSAHVGGLVCGLVLGFLLSLTKRASYPLQRPLRRVCLLLPLVLMVPLALLAKKRGEPWLHYSRALSSLRESHFPEAEKQARSALVGLPGDRRVLEILGLTLAYEGKDAEAAGYLRQIVDREPREPIVANTLARIELNSGDAIGARDLLTRTLARQPGNAEGQVYLGRALQELNDNAGAIQHYRQALQISPDLYEAQMALGSLYEKVHKPKDAALFYARAAQIDPTQIEPLQALARVYLAMGMKADADKVLAQIQRRQTTGADSARAKGAR